MASPGEEVSVFTYLYLSAGAPTLGETKGLIIIFKMEYLQEEIKSKNKNISLECINPLAVPRAGVPAFKCGVVNTETSSPGEVKGLILSKK